MAYTKYSLTPANNTATPPDGAPEGMLPSAVNDTMRDMMAQIRDCGDGIRDGTYTMTAPKITGGTITGVTYTSIVITGGSITGITDLAVADGGTGASTAANARTNLSAAASGANSDITSLTGLTTPLSQAQGGTGTTTGYYGFKNRIINGAMVIDQRNAGAATANTINGYTLDRWEVSQITTGKIIAQQNAGAVTPPVGFTNYLGITSQSAYSVISTDRTMISQWIEGFNVADLGWGTANAKTVTLSFWVRSSLTGTFGGAVINGTPDRGYPFSYTINTANTWEQKSVTITGDTSGTWATNNSAGLGIRFGLGVGSTYLGTAGAWVAGNYAGVTGEVNVLGTNGATFYITGVQLEVGSTATSFDYRPYTTEFQLCQRYFEVHGGTASAFPQYFGSGNNGTNVGLAIPFAVSKRTAPTVTALGTWTVSNCGQPFADSATIQGYRLAATCSSTNTIQFYPASSSEKVTISAEL